MKIDRKRELLIPNTLAFNQKVENGEEISTEDENKVLKESIFFHDEMPPQYITKEFKKIADYYLAKEVHSWNW